ncbi:hypothetical protein, partial [Bradyrhizobium liaoningense]|uniref:hypothetical protein n=1 Tax=Bradyrhizobium liaoningense TaxID=43992 RepID=UPI001AEC56A0
SSGEFGREDARACLRFKMRVELRCRPLLRHWERSDLSAEAFGEDGSKPESFHSDSWIASSQELRAMTRRRERAPNSILVPRTQRSVPSTVRCRAGAYAVVSHTVWPRQIGSQWPTQPPGALFSLAEMGSLRPSQNLKLSDGSSAEVSK